VAILNSSSMSSKDDVIKKLQKENREFKKENDYFKSPTFLWDVCEIIKGEYSILLNPPKKEFNTTKNQKACSFEININDIICILSNGKTKWIYFKEPQSSSIGIRNVSDKLSYTGNLTGFLKDFDRPNIHLCQISRSAIVNVFYYYLDRNKLRIIDTNKLIDSNCDKLSISSDYIQIFKARKSTIGNLTSFLKIDFRGKYSPLNSLHDSFES
jgi:hypothetical protein